MGETGQSKRAYNSIRRRAQAGQTRQQVADATRKLFAERGYAGTTIEGIAKEAGVAPETVYAIFRSKSKILWHLMDISVGGDDAPLTVLERPEPQAVFQETDQRQQIHMFAQGITSILVRAAPVFETMRSAAETEPEIAELLTRTTAERWENMQTVIQHIAANGPLREGLTAERAAADLWTLTSTQVFLLLTRDRGWTPEAYSEWLADSLVRLLLS